MKAYGGPSYFCDRVKETNQILEALQNSRDITLYSLRRMGKTGIIQHVKHKLDRKKDYIFVYVDLLNTENTDQMVSKMAKGLALELYNKKNILKKAVELFAKLRPVVTYDELSGVPNLSFDIDKSDKKSNSLIDLFQIIKNIDKQVIFALDEFQQISFYKDNGIVEASLREQIQLTNNAQFIFSGSQKNMLLTMFSNNKRAFYNSTQMMYLDQIPADLYAKFIAKWMKKGEVKIDRVGIDYILEQCLHHTWFVQMLCNRIFASGHGMLKGKQINRQVIRDILRTILSEKEISYINYRKLLSSVQWKLLKAVAIEERVYQVYKSDFIRKHNLSGTASVKRALDKLLGDEFIVEINETKDSYFRLNDVFLTRWIQLHYRR